MSEAMLSKVRKLLAQAEDPACTPAESAAFMAKATELIARYGVDRALLAAREPATDPVGDRVVEVVAPYARDKAGLLAAVADPLRCRCVRRRQGTGFAMHLFGFASDLERVELLFTSLLVQAAHGLAGAAVPAGEHPAAFRRTWLAGFAHVVAERLRAAEADAVAGSGAPSMALVLADRSGRVQRRLAEAYPRLRTAPARRLAGTGFGSGAAAGRRADLGGPGVAGAGTTRGIGR
ncbi:MULTISPECIES: DUF2786 domain-containing protein [Micromonospora]|uniref:DUF2786 domain-containing protein n=1 Tax=Micromonospora solifontis TaxID=2487138 RepID=A0ABX9WGN1_9ACTN|nr:MULTISPECIES: DUF2786 domain-containing protein [Micromonospora]NES14410.1 DUF2786 domain-containing protein [Micromonospora sp. PPF5-17B]NES36801.1 DUF2786 domain-containing protein [Micromonospora solifontis]NES56559.1 DUF2786 domain-containing protein [Micromonospora sp. PPF5-6]RNL99127.1 DUF2786 domain-containing protein [Micromonospora solifontis]